MSYTGIAIPAVIPALYLNRRSLSASQPPERPGRFGQEHPLHGVVVPLAMASPANQVSREKEPLKTGVSMDTLKRSQIVAVLCTGLTVIGVTGCAMMPGHRDERSAG